MTHFTKTKIAVSTSVLFDMSEADAIWRREQKGELPPGSYLHFMHERADIPMMPGPAFDNIRALAQSDSHEIIIMSRNSPSTALRAMRTLLANDIIPTQFVFTNGGPVTPYLDYYKPDCVNPRLRVHSQSESGYVLEHLQED